MDKPLCEMIRGLQTAVYSSTSVWKFKTKAWHALFDRPDRYDVLQYYAVFFHMDFDLCVEFALCV